MMNKIFNFLKFLEFINEFGKICFPLGKMEFRTQWKFYAYHRSFDPSEGPANTLIEKKVLRLKVKSLR